MEENPQGETTPATVPTSTQTVPTIADQIPAPVVEHTLTATLDNTPQGSETVTHPQVETFEGDIQKEIKDNSTSVAQIASIDGKVETTHEKKPISLALVLGIVGAILVIILAGLGYYFFVMKPSASTPEVTPITTNTTPFPVAANSTSTQEVSPSTYTLDTLLPRFSNGVGRYIGSIRVEDGAYILPLTQFNPVFAYVLRNEDDFRNELFTLFYQASSTAMFGDISVSNVDMRALTDGSSTLAYAFFDTTYLVIATSTDTIARIHSVIIK